MHLSKIIINHYRGIEHIEAQFAPNINVIIGPNGSCKSAVIDAIRLLYNIGEAKPDIIIEKDDFFEKMSVPVAGLPASIDKSKTIDITYEFRGLTDQQKGAFYEYLIIDTENPENDFAKVELKYLDEESYISRTINTGGIEGQKADLVTFRFFQHYYLSALRDSTRDLLSYRNNILGKVISRLVKKNKTEDDIKGIMKTANDELLQRDEVKQTQKSINDNLDQIGTFANNLIGLHIETNRIEYIVNSIRPYLPYDKDGRIEGGFQLSQNSLGYNNLIYIATVLGDIQERIGDDKTGHYCLLIEEPEAHLHPQLQLSLYNFLNSANASPNSQLFITTHSPTLTSRVPLNNLILLNSGAYSLANVFIERDSEKILQDVKKQRYLGSIDFIKKRNQLERYIDVTKSQLFFAKACLFVEGISEELLVPAFCTILDIHLDKYGIEVINVGGLSFYPFLTLFNSPNDIKRLPHKVSVITDDDRYPKSKESFYSIKKLVQANYARLNRLYSKITTLPVSSRIDNLLSYSNGQPQILIKYCCQTFEYQLLLSNVNENPSEFENNTLVQFIKLSLPTPYSHVLAYIKHLNTALFSEEQRSKIAILLWKCIPVNSKADFAQSFASLLIQTHKLGTLTFNIPEYLKQAIQHLK